jgi:hypothetical protein
MSTPQLTYQRDYNLPSAGSPYDGDDNRSSARINGESVAIPVGIAVKEDSTDGKIKLLSAGGDRVAGILINSYARNPNNLTGTQAFAAGDSLNMLERGALWVATEQDVALTDPVFVRHTSDGGSNTQPGTFRKDADSGRAQLLKGARWVRAGSAGGSAAIYFDSGIENALGGGAVVTFDNASVSSDTTKKIFQNRSDRYFKIEAVEYVNPTGLAADASNYFVLKVLNAAAVAAQWSTQTGADGALAADTFAAFTLTAANCILAPRRSCPFSWT